MMIILCTILIFNSLFGQIKPYEEPTFIKTQSNTIEINDINYNDNLLQLYIQNKSNYFIVELPKKQLHTLEIINYDNLDKNINFFIIDYDTFAFNGPYNTTDIITDPINTKNILVEINCLENCNTTVEIMINEFKNQSKKYNTTQYKYNKRENPTILVTGYWPPTNEMIRHFSEDEQLNPDGWLGNNWENSGYNIVSYFPTFDDPNCSSCGQGNGILQVDYQNTSEDFWPIAENREPIAIITFSRGFNNLSWELEFNAYNRTNWYSDYQTPFLPTPNPPDSDQESYYLRNSNLPMDNIVHNIQNLNLGLDPYIDINGDPGQFVSEFMAYHGTWYRDLNLDKCIAAGHVHVGGQIDVQTAKIAANETIRTLINYLNESTYLPGDSNLDNIVDILDLVQIINNILGNTELSNIQFLASDVNEDSIINIQDIILVVNMILNN